MHAYAHTVNDQATYIQQYRVSIYDDITYIQQYRVSMMTSLNSFCVYLLIGYPYPIYPDLIANIELHRNREHSLHLYYTYQYITLLQLSPPTQEYYKLSEAHAPLFIIKTLVLVYLSRYNGDQ